MMILDTLRNLVSGLGTSKDKSVANVYVTRELTPEEMIAMYRGDGFARKLVDIPAKDSTKNWRDWKATKEQIESIEAVEKKPTVKLAASVCYAKQMARLFGGSILYFAVKGQNPATPLDLEKVRKDSLQYVRVWHVHQIGSEGWEDDIGSEWYGQPKFYTVANRIGENVRIHPSRVIRFTGMPRPDVMGTSVWYGDSVLQVAYDSIANASSAEQHVGSLVTEAKTDVMYIPGLGQILSTEEGTKALTARFAYANQMKSQYNMLLLDGIGAETDDGESKGETWEQKQIRFADLPDLLTHFIQVLAGVGDIPLTRFLGTSAAGLNATGENDLRNYYDGLAGDQRNDLSPTMAPLDEVIIRSALGSRDPSVYYVWSPLWLPTPKEAAEIFEKRTQGVKTLKETSLIPAPALSEAAVNMLIEDGTLVGIEAAIATHGDFSSMSEEEQNAAKGIVPEPVEPANDPEKEGAAA